MKQSPYEPQGTLNDAFTGEEFEARARNHYEVNDGVPVAPRVEVNRPTIRQRIENLINRGVDPLANYVGHDGYNMDVPDDPDAPLTASEQMHIDMLAADLAEQAPLPDEGLPRPPQDPPAASSGGAGGSTPPAEGASAPVPPAPSPSGGKLA